MIPTIQKEFCALKLQNTNLCLDKLQVEHSIYDTGYEIAVHIF